MTKQKMIFIAVMLALIFLALSFIPTGASDGIPPDVTRFYDCGYVCYVWPDGSGDCYLCQGCDTSTYTDDVKTEKPTEPTVKPTQIPPDTPEPTPKEKCNSGRGNGSEGQPDCDPGNSGKNQGGD